MARKQPEKRDECSPRQRTWLDGWARLRWLNINRVIYNGGRFYLLLKRTKTYGFRYGIYPPMTWDEIRAGADEYLREQREFAENWKGSHI